MLQVFQAYQGAAEPKEGLVDVGFSFVADEDVSHVIEPREGVLQHAGPLPQLLAGVDPGRAVRLWLRRNAGSGMPERLAVRLSRSRLGCLQRAGVPASELA